MSCLLFLDFVHPQISGLQSFQMFGQVSLEVVYAQKPCFHKKFALLGAASQPEILSFLQPNKVSKPEGLFSSSVFDNFFFSRERSKGEIRFLCALSLLKHVLSGPRRSETPGKLKSRSQDSIRQGQVRCKYDKCCLGRCKFNHCKINPRCLPGNNNKTRPKILISAIFWRTCFN